MENRASLKICALQDRYTMEKDQIIYTIVEFLEKPNSQNPNHISNRQAHFKIFRRGIGKFQRFKKLGSLEIK